MEFKKTNITSNKHRNAILSDKERKEIHQRDFGYQVPKDFFKKSKNAILEQTIKRQKRQQIIKMISFSSAIAAVFVLFFAIGKFQNKSVQVALNDPESNMLLNSLFANDTKVNSMADAYMLGSLYTEDDMLN